MLNSKKAILFYLLFCPVLLIGQNLVLNGDFESYNDCPTEEGHWEGYATGWTTFFGTPDYLNCNLQGPAITPPPHSGTGLASCVWFDTDYANPPNVKREYLVGELTEGLTAAEDYYLFFLIYIDDQSPVIKHKHVGIVQTGDYEYLDEFIVSADITLEHDEYFPTSEWYKISTCFTANGGEDQIILGNFFTNEQTVYVDTVLGFTNFNFIDDIGLYAFSSLVPADTAVLAGSLYHLDTQMGQYYEIAGQEIRDGQYYFEEAGIYEVGVYIEECGQIGVYEIEVLDCATYIENRALTYLPDLSYCVQEGQIVNLAAYDHITYYHEMQAVEALNLSTIGDEVIYMYDADCGLIDSIVYTGIDCSFASDSTCFYVPNVFSPNDDGVNDKFEIQGNCMVDDYHLKIFDRWGNYVFESRDITHSWKGYHRGEACSQGVYMYTLSIDYELDYKKYRQQTSGTLSLIR